MKRLGDGELEIMLAVWGEEEPVSSTLVQEKLRGRRDWALPAVITALNRLVEKGFLACWTASTAAASRAWWPPSMTAAPSEKMSWRT